MATSAPRKIRKPVQVAEQEPHRPWWHWFLVYPTVGLALISAAPLWFDKAGAMIQGVRGDSLKEAQRQNAFWIKNSSCWAAPQAWYNSPKNIKIDATICKSGDIFVRAVTPTGGEHFRWLGLEDVVKPGGGGGEIVPSAQAASLPFNFGAPPAQSLFHQAQVVTLCQRFDGRYIMRRVQTPQGCFQEVIDTFNGAVVHRQPAPCANQC